MNFEYESVLDVIERRIAENKKLPVTAKALVRVELSPIEWKSLAYSLSLRADQFLGQRWAYERLLDVGETWIDGVKVVRKD